MTQCLRPSFCAARATFVGSFGSRAAGLPFWQPQKAQSRVHTSPRIINVAVSREKHSAMFGHRASSQTVCRLRLRSSFLVLWTCGVNLFSARSQGVFDALARSDPPFYAVFFVMAGADLDARLVPAMGLFGAYYLLARGGGKILGARIGTKRLDVETSLQRYLGTKIN